MTAAMPTMDTGSWVAKLVGEVVAGVQHPPGEGVYEIDGYITISTDKTKHRRFDQRLLRQSNPTSPSLSRYSSVSLSPPSTSKTETRRTGPCPSPHQEEDEQTRHHHHQPVAAVSSRRRHRQVVPSQQVEEDDPMWPDHRPTRYLPGYVPYGIDGKPYRTISKGNVNLPAVGMAYVTAHSLPTISSLLKSKDPRFVQYRPK
eukprot:GHVS01097252.1.p1 GENE.GHVS01097252.1~~GHVS01097252.1.p1  ORF type:complete len:201 (-),score=27.33 GHVS01097252.1:355-957(-)